MLSVLCSFVSAALTDNLVAYWNFDGDATDSAASYDMTAVNAPTNNAANGIINEGYLFDGTTQYLHNTNTDIQPIGDFSLSVWIKTSDASFSIFEQTKSPGYAAPNHIYLSVGRPSLSRGNGASQTTLNTVTTVDDSNFHHIIFTASGTTMKIFIDGVLRASGSSGAQSITQATTQTAIAKYSEVAVYTAGSEDEIGLWNRALTDGGVAVNETATGEIAELYNSGSGFQYPFTPDYVNFFAIDNLTGNPINSFSVDVQYNETYSTTNGTINSELTTETNYYNLTYSSSGYYDKIILNQPVNETLYNVTTDMDRISAVSWNSYSVLNNTDTFDNPIKMYFKINGSLPMNCSIYRNETLQQSLTELPNNAEYHLNVTVNDSEEKSYVLRLSCSDSHANYNTSKNIFSDTKNPVIYWGVNVPNGIPKNDNSSILTGNVSLNIRITNHNLTWIYYSVWNTSENLIYNNTATPSYSEYNITDIIDSSNFTGDGYYFINVTANDTVHNFVSDAKLFGYDNTPPSINIPVNDSYYNLTGNIYINGTASDFYLTSLVINNSKFTNIGNITDFMFKNNTNLSNGNYSVLITGTDIINLTSDVLISFQIDIAPPFELVNGTFEWLIEEDFNTGTYTNTYWNDPVMLNNSLSGSYCSAIKNTYSNFTEYINMTWSGVSYDFIQEFNISDVIAWYHLNDAGSNIEDSSGYGNNGTYNGVLNHETGIHNYSVGFDGADDNILIPDTDILEPSEISVCLWFKNDAETHEFPYLFSEGDASVLNGANLAGYILGLINNDDIRFAVVVETNTYRIATYAASLETNTWYHICGTYSNPNNYLYLDGAKVGEETTGGVIDYSGDSDETFIGRGTGGISDQMLDGLIDEIIVFNRSLTPEEIQLLYNSTSTNYSYNLIVNKSLNFSIRTCDDHACSGENFTYIGNSPQNLTWLPVNRYVQWCADFETTDKDYPPTLDDVIINYGYLPEPNNPPTIPTDLTLSPDPLYINFLLYALASGSTDADNDTISYYYKFEDTFNYTIQNYSLSNNTNVSDYENKTIKVYAKAYDGQNYSNAVTKTIDVLPSTTTTTTTTTTTLHHQYSINESDVVRLGRCPDTENSRITMWLIIGVCLLLGIIGMIIKNVYFVIISGFALIFLSLSMILCGAVVGYILMLFGIGFIITGLNIKPLT